MIFSITTSDNFRTVTSQRMGNLDALDSIDKKILHEIEACGCYGENPWKVLGRVANMYSPASREDARELRRKLWERLKKLIKSKLVYRFNRKYVTTKRILVPRQKRRRMPRIYRPPSVANNQGVTSGSTFNLKPSSKEETPTQIAELKAVTTKSPSIGGSENTIETKSANAFGDVSAAARTLSKLRRSKARKWTGYIGNERIYRDREVVLPDGTIAFIFGVRRNKAIITLDRGRLLGGFREPDDPMRWFVTDVKNVKLRVNPAAQLLGLQKRGRKEKYSVRKADAARRNGSKPSRPGSKPRGRPKVKSIN